MKIMVALMAVVLASASLVGGADDIKTPRFEARGLDSPRLPERGRAAAVVSFDGKPYSMVFKLPWVTGYATPEGLICAQGYSETFDRKKV